MLTAATKVHRELGPGLLESVCELALMVELGEGNIPARRQVEIPVKYRGRDLGIGFRADIIVADCLKRGYLLNFNKPLLKEGIKRVSI